MFGLNPETQTITTMRKLYALMLTGLASLGLSAQTSPYCGTQVYHFGIPAEVPSSVYLTISSNGPNSLFVEIESADADAVDDLIVNSSTPGWTPSAINGSVPGKLSRTITWSSALATADINVLWSKASFPGNWMLNATDITVNIADTCSGTTPPPAPGGQVTLSVDMSNYGGTYTGVFVNGTFNGWCGSCNPMTDMGNGIWEVSLPLAVDSIDYKFTLDGWTGQENFSGGESCTKTKGGFTNRYLRILGDTTVSTVCWESCAACPGGPAPVAGNIQFNVDMDEYNGLYSKVYVSGTFNGWCGNCNELTDIDGDGVYSGTVANIGPGAIEYKFTLDNWAGQENLTPGSSCTVTNSGFTNRSYTINGNAQLPTVCWESCNACGFVSPTKDVTFRVNMSDYAGSFTTVFVSGSFNNWAQWDNPLTDMGNGMWEATLPLTQDSIEYKFQIDGWVGQENFNPGASCTKTTGGFTNRFLVINSDTTLTNVCWESCSECMGIPSSVNVTFKVDMRGYSGSWTTVNLNGTFNGWCGSCWTMTDADGDSIYEITELVSTSGIEYKFTVDGWNDQENLTPGDPCTITTGAFTNRYLMPTQDTVMPAVCWEACSECSTSAADYNVTFRVNMSLECAYDSVHVSGDFNSWSTSGVSMTDMGNGVYTATVTVPAGSNDFKFRKYVNGTEVWESISNRNVVIGSDSTLELVCFNSSSNCGMAIYPTATVVGNYSVRFRWNNTGATSYGIRLREVGHTDWLNFSTTDTFRILDNRYPNSYEYYIEDQSSGVTSCLNTFIIDCADDIVYTYNVFQAPELGRFGRVRVFGTQGGKRLYDIYLVNSAGDTTSNSHVRQRNFTDLPADSYMIYVNDDFGCAADSVGQFTINSMDTARIPNLINAPNNSPNGFRPTWNSVDGVINYQLRVLNVTDGTLVDFITGITDTMRAVTGLTPGKLYRFNVRSRYNNGVATVNSGYSNPVSRNLPAGGNKDGESSDISETGTELISIYPNPTSSVLFVVAPVGSELSLLDINGRVISSRIVDSIEEQFEMSSLSEGVYMLRVISDQGVTTQRIIKQ